MSTRASAAAQTRRRIIDATRALHTEQGIAATSWDDIAARAGVGVGTVYRHFPSLDELVPACGEISMQIVALPDPTACRALFDGADAPARAHRAPGARGVRDLRARRAGAARDPQRARRPPERRRGRRGARGLARRARRRGRRASTPADRAVVRAMIDLGTWQALRDQGLGPAEAVDAVSRMLAARSTRP